ncbi:Probable serine/threonine-protein kinase fnkA (FNIP repeat-containing protein A), partial [Durusdinium trenchii]
MATEEQLLKLQVSGLDGQSFTFHVDENLLGRALWQRVVEQLPPKAGARVVLLKGAEKLCMKKTLKEQGLSGDASDVPCLSFVYRPVNLLDAWRFLSDPSDGEGQELLEGLTELVDVARKPELLPSTLKKLRIDFDEVEETHGDQTERAPSFPAALESLTFGDRFDQSLLHFRWPHLRRMAFGWHFNQTLENITWPSQLQSLTLGWKFNQSLERVDFPKTLQSLTLGSCFNQSLGVNWPSTLTNLTLGEFFDQSLDGVALPERLHSLTFGSNFNQKLQG